MALTKRVLCIALALLLGAALFAPAVSAEADSNAPVITKQPNVANTIMFTGNELKLEIEVSLPAGSNGTLSVAWYDYDWQPGDEAQPVATGEKATIIVPHVNMFTPDGLSIVMNGINYYAVATHSYVDDEGQELVAIQKSDRINIDAFPPFSQYMSNLWELMQRNLLIAIFAPFATMIMLPVYGFVYLLSLL